MFFVLSCEREKGKRLIILSWTSQAVRVWAESLAAPSKNLASLFPGIAGAKGSNDDDMEE
jgi:hypothetical protein